MPPQTMQESLSGQLPDLVLNDRTPITPKLSHHWIKVDPDKVMEWQDFTLTNLKNAYGHVFDLSCEIPVPVRDIRSEYLVHNSEEVKKHGIEILNQLLRHPLKEGIGKLRESGEISEHEVHCDYRAPLTPNQHWCWGVFYALPETNLVVSCARLSNTFKSEDLHNNMHDAVWVLHQLASRAVDGGTRHGFIVTDKEVVVVRFFSLRDSHMYGAEWKAIPWNTFGKDQLTPALAVYSLVLMSLNDSHRDISSRENTFQLDCWIREETKSDGKLTFHHFASGRRLDALSDGVDYYWEDTNGGLHELVPVSK
ncbi:hypothetical protein ACHAPT_009886 [Fusarium lateritium]